MSRYRKITVAMWGDARFRELSAPPPNARYLWIHLLTGPHTGPIPGLSVAGEAALAEALGWSLAKFRQCFKEIAAQEMAEADWKARVLFLPKAIHHNPPESPNVVRAWRAYMAEIAECPLKAKAEAMLKGWLEAKGKAWGEAFGEAFPEGLALSGAGTGTGTGTGTGVRAGPLLPPHGDASLEKGNGSSRAQSSPPSRHVNPWGERESA